MRLNTTGQIRFKTHVLRVTVIAFLTSLSVNKAVAQSDEQATQATDEIIVTGSRLTRSGFETPSPVTVIGNDDIRASTAVVLGDLLNELPNCAIHLDSPTLAGSLVRQALELWT